MKTYRMHIVANQFRTWCVGVTGLKFGEEGSGRDSSLRCAPLRMTCKKQFFSNLRDRRKIKFTIQLFQLPRGEIE